jgi:magnesium chelatase subunit I
VHVPELAKDILEQIAFEARTSEYVDAKSGVSARMSITAYENLISTAERRALLNNEQSTTVRFSDLMGMIPSITGKVELVYEGEQEGSYFVANQLISEATKTLFLQYFPKIEKLKKEGQEANDTINSHG